MQDVLNRAWRVFTCDRFDLWLGLRHFAILPRYTPETRDQYAQFRFLFVRIDFGGY